MKRKIISIIILLLLVSASVADNSNEILLRSRRFTPAKGISATAKAKIAAVPDRAHVLLQLEQVPTVKERKELEAEGIKLLAYVPNKAWLASIPSDKASEIAALSQVRAISELLPEDKVVPYIKRGEFIEGRVKDGKADLVVKFFPDISLDEAEQVVLRRQAFVVGRVPTLNALVVTLETDKSMELANEETVMWIEQELPLEPINDGARAATGVETVQNPPVGYPCSVEDYDLAGRNVQVLIYDAGLVDKTHDDFGSRVTEGETGSVSYHATHVAGTVGADGSMSEYGGSPPGEDCGCFPTGEAPEQVIASLWGIEKCVDGWPPCPPQELPPNGTYILTQDTYNPCRWEFGDGSAGEVYVVWLPKPPGSTSTMWASTYIDTVYFKGAIDGDCPADFSNTFLCTDPVCGTGGMGHVSWYAPPGEPGEPGPDDDDCIWRGMAPACEMISYYVSGECVWDGDDARCLYDDSGQLSDMDADFTDGINNHGADIGTASVGCQPARWLIGCQFEGDYSAFAELIDSIIYNKNDNYDKRIPITWAAANERGYGTCGTSYSTISPTSTAKNAIIVGATNSNDDSMTYFSSWGPTDDGRIKPDVVAPGCQVGGDGGITSTIPVDTYGTACGTSMATPVVAGSTALMLEHWRNTHAGEPDPLPSTVKAIFVQTGKDLGNTGPDYSFGYGLIDMVDAVDLIDSDSATNRVILEDSILQTNDRDYLRITVPQGQSELRITLVWDDYPATELASSTLVNDLDLIVKGPDQTRYYPWTLNPANPGDAAVQTQEDHKNNVEQVYVNNPTSGTWTIEVKGYNIAEPVQDYSLVSLGNLALEISKSFLVKNSSGQDTAWFDSLGNLVLKGTLSGSPPPPNPGPEDEFVFRNDSGHEVAIIDAPDGDMHIKGTVYEEQSTLSPSSGNDFIIRNAVGDIVAYIDESTGNVYLKGKLYENWGP